MRHNNKPKIAAFLAVTLCLINGFVLHAATTWVGGTASNDLTNATNWGGALPLSTDTVTFPTLSSGDYSPAPFLTPGTSAFSSFTVGGMTFTTNQANPINITNGGILTIGSVGINASSTAANTANFTVTGAGSRFTNNGPASNNTTANTGTVNYTIASGGSLTLNGVGQVTGTGNSIATVNMSGSSFFKTGTSTVVLDTLNSSTSGDSLSFFGPVQVGNSTTNQTISGSILGNSTFTKAGTNKLSLGGTNTILGAITINAGTLQGLGHFSIPNTSIVNNGTLEFSAGSATTYSGAMSGAGILLIDTNTPLTLTGNNVTNATGSINIMGGSTLSVTNQLNLTTGLITLDGANQPATLKFTGNGGVIINNITTTLGSNNHPSHLILENQTITLTGSLTNNAGLEISGGLGILNVTTQITGAGVINVDSGINFVPSYATNTNTGGISIFGPASAVSIVADGNLGTYSSDLNISNGGILNINAAGITTNPLRNIAISFGGGVFQLNGNDFTLGNQVNLGFNDLTVYGSSALSTSGSADITFSGLSGDSSSLIILSKGAQAILNANNTFSGSITVNGYGDGAIGGENANINSITASNNLGDDSITNSLTVQNNGLIGFTGSTTFDLRPVILGGGGATFDVAPTFTATLNGTFSNSSATGVLYKENGGTVEIGGDTTNLVQIGPDILAHIDGGTLRFTNDMNIGININSAGDTELGFRNNGSTSYSGVYSGLGNLAVDGNKILTLLNTNTYSGGTTVGNSVGAGTVDVSTDANLGAVTGDLVLNGNGTLVTIATGGHARNINLTNVNGNSNGISIADTYTVPFSGTLSGNGGFNKLDEGTMVLQGTTNTYDGPTIVTGGTLQTGSQNLPAGAAINIDTAGTLNFAQATSGTYTGIISSVSVGSGNITTANSISKLIITANSGDFTGTTTIPAGELNTATGSFLGGNFNVNTGGILSGSGVLGGTGYTLTSAGGTIHPGNSPGILTYTGNAVLTNGTFAVDINGQGNIPGTNNSELVVGGTATIGGGENVVVTSNDGSFFFGGNYTILNAASVAGQFNPSVVTINALTGLPLFITPLLTYDGQDAYLDFQTPLFDVTENNNEKNVLKQLASIKNPKPNETTLLSNLTVLTQTGFLDALDDLSGVQYTQLQLATELTTNQFLRRLYDPVRLIIGQDPCYVDWNPYCGSLWMDGSGSRAFFKNTNEAQGFKINGYQITGGIQAQYDCYWTLGLAGTYEKDHYNFNLTGSSGKSDTALGSFYGLYRPEDFYVLADLVLGASRTKVERTFSIGPVTYNEEGRPKTIQGAFYVEAGFDLACSYFNLQPFAGIQCGYFNAHKFEESGTDPVALGFQNQSYGTADSRLGLHFTSSSLNSPLTLSADFAWQYRLNHQKNKKDAYFENFGTVFETQGAHIDPNAFDGAVNITNILNESWSIYLSGNGQKWKNASAFNVTAGLTATW